MPKQAWAQGVSRQTTNGTLLNTFTTAKTVINQESLFPIGANQLSLGDDYRITVLFALSNIVTTPGTVTFQVMLGSIVIFTTGAIQMNATAHVLLPCKLVVDLQFQLANVLVGGAVAKFMGQGVLTGRPFTRVAGATDATEPVVGVIDVPITSPALGTAFDSTIAQTFDFWTGFSISNVGNGIQVAQYKVEPLN